MRERHARSLPFPLNIWFDVEIRCHSNKASVYLNGVKVLSGILQGQLRHGRIGVVTHSATGTFDNVAWRELK